MFSRIQWNRTRLRLQDKRCCFWLNAQPPQESVVFTFPTHSKYIHTYSSVVVVVQNTPKHMSCNELIDSLSYENSKVFHWMSNIDWFSQRAVNVPHKITVTMEIQRVKSSIVNVLIVSKCYRNFDFFVKIEFILNHTHIYAKYTIFHFSYTIQFTRYVYFSMKNS